MRDMADRAGATLAREQGPRPARPPGELRLEPEQRLWRRYAEGRDPAVREELVRRHLSMAERIASRYHGATEPFDDLRQVAGLGLLNAIDRFDPGRGIPFPAFAAPTILGELKRHFRDRAWTIKVPRGIHDLLPEVEKATVRLAGELQRSPSVNEIADHLEVTPEQVLDVLEAGEKRSPLSFDRPLGAGEDETPASEMIGSEESGFDLAEHRLALARALPLLDRREQLILVLRFQRELTQREIAERIGCSQMHVSRILRRTLDRIRGEISGA